jgi:Uma2 family endonuclease
MSAPSSVDELDQFHVLADGRILPSLYMTEDEFERWALSSGVRAEWVDGEVIIMSPSNLLHVRLTRWLLVLLSNFVSRRPVGEMLGPDFMVRFASQRRRRVPDLLFVSNERASLLRPTYLDGAPDTAFEIVSPDSQSRDRREKFLEYQKAGVREYWIIDPLSQTIEAYALTAGKYELMPPDPEGRLPSAVIGGFYLKPDWLWQQPLPDVISILREMGVQM